jgi:hypothetical protein
VWVVNQHDEDILVVVSKYRPSRMLSSGGITALTMGAGISFSSTVSDPISVYNFFLASSAAC